MGLTLNEQELQVNMCGRTDEIEVYTSYPHMIKKFDKYCAEHPENWKCTGESKAGGEVVGKFYTAPRDLLKLAAKKRFVSEEQRRASAERLARFRKERESGEEELDKAE